MSYNVIIHVSDLHIRSDYDRIDEYLKVFEKLYESIKLKIKRRKALIICTGDIIHDRYKITPSVIYLVHNFLRLMSDIGYLVIIDGNHDISVGKEQEKRLLQVIEKPKNVEYIDKTGEYVFNNVTAGISTLVDNNFIRYDDIVKKDDNLVIGVGHYTLTEWLDERNLPVTNRTKSVNDFKGYSHVLLGDIHSRKKYSNCRYSGSLIQQNFGETGKSHGYSLLDIKKDKWENIDIISDYTFKNIYIEENGDLTYKGDFTKYSYIKIHCASKYSHLEEDYKNKIGELTEIKRFNMNIIHNTDNILTKSLDDIVLEIGNISEDKIIKSIVEDSDHLESIFELHKKYTSSNSYNFKQNKSKWYLKNITFENILKYRGKHSINFDDMEGIVGISGLNTSGKSSLLKILIFGLCGENTIDFSQVSTEYTKISQHHNHYKFENIYMLNYNNPIVKKGCVEVVIEHNNKIYKIKRELLRQQTGSISTKTTISDKDNNIIETSSSGSKSKISEKEVNKIIYDLIGRSTDLYSLNVINRNSSSFTEMTDVAKFNVISNLFNLNIYNDIAKKIKEDISNLKEKIIKSKGRKEQVFEPLNIDVENIDVDSIKQEIKELSDRRDMYKSLRCDKLLKEYKSIGIEINDDTIISKFEELLKNKQKYQKNITPDIFDCKSVQPKGNISRSQIYKEYKTVCHINSRTKIPDIKDLPSSCKTNITEKDVDKIQNEMNKYNYDIDDLIDNKVDYEHIIAKYKFKSDNKEPSDIIDIPELLEFPDIDSRQKKILYPEKVVKDLDIDDLKNKLQGIEVLPLKHVSERKVIKYNRDSLSKSIEETMSKINKYIEIDDIIESLKLGKLKKPQLVRLEDLKDLKKVILDISSDISEDTKKLKLLDVDEQYNKQLDIDIAHNKKISINDQKYKEISKLINEKEKWNHNQELNKLIPYFIEINKRLYYISLYEKYTDLKKGYLQHISYLNECNKMYEKRLEYEKYLKYYNEDSKINIDKIDKKLTDIYNEAQRKIEDIDKNILSLEAKLKAKDSILNINDSLEKLTAEMDILTLYNKIISENIKATILSKFLEQISDHSNDILKDLVSYNINLSVNIDPNDRNNRIKLNIVRDNNAGTHSLSAYEEFCLNLVIKVILNTFSSNGTATFLILDEALECIDHKNKPKIENLFKLLKRRYKNILLITHIHEYFTSSDHMILVTEGKLKFN